MKYIKKHIKLIILLLVILSVILIYKYNNHNNINYTAIGDNLTIGKNSFGIVDYSYADYVNEYLKERKKLNKYIKSFSHSNLTIDKLYDYILMNKKITLNNKEYNIRQTLRETNILTIQVGLNDLKYQISMLEINSPSNLERIILEIDNSFSNLISEIRKYYQNDIYVIGYYEKGDNTYLNTGINMLNKIYAKNKNIIYIPIDEVMKEEKYYSNELSYYPNRYGYEAISNEIINKMAKKLEKDNNS